LIRVLPILVFQFKKLLNAEVSMSESAISASPIASPLRMLIADDSGPMRRVVKELFAFGPGNWLVCGESVDGQDALRKAAELQPDAILLDLSIPALSGLEAARILQRENPSVVLVLMSAQEQAVLERIAAAARVPFCISKSLLGSHLIPLLDKIACQKRTAHEAA
jgi:DNA-binding NarL/FixJ family response regulator